MEDVSVAHAKEHLEELVARAARGEEISIVDPKVGKVKLTLTGTTVTRARKPRQLGLLEGKMKVPHAFWSRSPTKSLRTGTATCRRMSYSGPLWIAHVFRRLRAQR